jgi:hypothetical protein
MDSGLPTFLREKAKKRERESNCDLHVNKASPASFAVPNFKLPLTGSDQVEV